MNKEHLAKLKGLITPYLPEDVGVEDIKAESHFIDELNINSANLVDIVLDVEDAFDITFQNEDIDAMKTVEDALLLIARKQEEKN